MTTPSIHTAQLEISPADALRIFDTVNAAEGRGFPLAKVDGVRPPGSISRADFAREQGWSTDTDDAVAERAFKEACFLYGQAFPAGDEGFLCVAPGDDTDQAYNGALKVCMDDSEFRFPGKFLPSLAAAEKYLGPTDRSHPDWISSALHKIEMSWGDHATKLRAERKAHQKKRRHPEETSG